MTLDFTAKMKYNISSTLFRDWRDTMQKTSIRFFEDIPVRAVWDDESSKWWFCASDNENDQSSCVLGDCKKKKS